MYDCAQTAAPPHVILAAPFKEARNEHHLLRTSLAAAGMAVATLATAQVTFYEREGFEGRSFTTTKKIAAFDRYGFNDRASSVVVTGTDRWEVCETPSSPATALSFAPAGTRTWLPWA